MTDQDSYAHARHDYHRDFNHTDHEIHHEGERTRARVDVAERALHADHDVMRSQVNGFERAAAADEDVTRTRISDSERRNDAHWFDNASQHRDLERNAHRDSDRLSDQITGFELRADDKFDSTTGQLYNVERNNHRDADNLSGQLTNTMLRSDDHFSVASGQLYNVERRVDNSFNGTTMQFADLNRRVDDKFDASVVQVAGVSDNVDATRRDVWMAERELHRDHDVATRDLWRVEKGSDRNFREAGRTAFETTGRLADRLAHSESALVGALKDLSCDVRLDIAQTKAEVRESELRTAERIMRDGDRTRDMLHRQESQELARDLEYSRDKRLAERTEAHYERGRNADYREYRTLHEIYEATPPRKWADPCCDPCDPGKGRRRRDGGGEREANINRTFVNVERESFREDSDRHDRHERVNVRS